MGISASLFFNNTAIYENLDLLITSKMYHTNADRKYLKMAK